MTTTSDLLTAEDLMRLHSKGVRGELVRGVLNETIASGVEHGEIVMQLGLLLGNFVVPRRLGRLIGSDAGVLLERSPDTVREPDIAFISAERLPLRQRVTGYAEVAPDLVVEIMSPTDSADALQDKARMWLTHGVKLVWVIHPDQRRVDVHRLEQPVERLNEHDQLDGLEALPGFHCPVASIFGPADDET